MADGSAWQGSRNLRDLGGRPLAGGGRTRPGRVLRSGAPEYLTDAGWAAAKAAGLRTVIDLRNAPLETQRGPHHPVVSAAAFENIAFVVAPTEDPGNEHFLEVCGPWLDHPRSWNDNATLAQSRIAHVMRVISETEGMMLVHCAGGRDRTGMISAMLLQLAGATSAAIADDYEAGWRGAANHAGHAWVYAPELSGWAEHPVPRPSAEKIGQQLAERLPWVHRWAGSFDTVAYLASAGLTSDQLRSLRKLLNDQADQR